MLIRNADFPHKAKEKWATDLNTTLPQDTFSCYFQTYTNAPYPQNEEIFNTDFETKR